MHSTRISLIHKLADRNQHAWDELDRTYRPLIYRWLRRFPLQAFDVEDLTQEVMAVLVRDVSEFQHNGRVGAFRNWLRTTCANLAMNYLRRGRIVAATGTESFQGTLSQLEDPSSDLSRVFDLEYNRMVISRLLKRVSSQFEPITLEIFRTHVVDGKTAAETARQMNVSAASVHAAKSRVLRRLRQAAPDRIGEME